jgi:hypothetical protein
MTMGAVRIGAEAGRAAENPRRCFCDRELAPKVRGHLGDGSLSCGTGPWLTREYQGDHRRQSLTSTSISAALDISSHIKHRAALGACPMLRCAPTPPALAGDARAPARALRPDGRA